LHTLYWHPDPMAVLVACRRAVRPGGHAIVLNYTRAASVTGTFGALCAEAGVAEAVRALRWLVPTAAFEMLRRSERRYLQVADVIAMMAEAGFDVLDARRTFLAGVSALAWGRAPDDSGQVGGWTD